MKRKHWILIIVLALVVIGAIFYFSKSKDDAEDENSDNYIYIEKGTITNKLLISGEITSSKEVSLKSELAGIIDKLFVNVGDHVSKGNPIAKIRILPDPQSTQDAQRQVNTAKIDLDKVTADFDRYQFLYDSGVISRQEYDNAVRDYKVAQENLTSAQNYQRIVKKGYANKSDFVSDVIYSTIDGIVLDLPVKIGGSITNRNTFNDGTTIATIADMSEILFVGNVSENALEYLKVGKQLNVKINAIKDENFIAHITSISPKGENVGGIIKFEIEAKVNISPFDVYKIKSGFSAVADFVLEQASDVWILEDKYIQYDSDTAYVNVEGKNDKQEKKTIEIGISDGQFTEIKKGLTQEDKIIKKSM